MCPLGPVSPPADLGFHSTDEEIIMALERYIQGELPPSNVITEVNPHNVLPENLPQDVWYLFNSEDPKTTATGCWKATVEDFRILANSSTTGSRTTLEFYEGLAPHETKTEWLMHEYRVNRKGVSAINKIQDSRSLSRVFLTYDPSSKHKEQHNQAGAGDAKFKSIMLNAEENNHNAQDLSLRPQVISGVDEVGTLAVPERNIGDPRLDYLVEDGDFLELLDLENSESPSSSSEHSSCLTMSSDEGFDPSALMWQLEAGNDQDMQQKHTASKFSVSVSHRPNQVVIRPESSGFLLGSNRSSLPSGNNLIRDTSLPGSAVEQKIHEGDRNRLPSEISQNVLLGSNRSSLPSGNNLLHDTSLPGLAIEQKIREGDMNRLPSKMPQNVLLGGNRSSLPSGNNLIRDTSLPGLTIEKKIREGDVNRQPSKISQNEMASSSKSVKAAAPAAAGDGEAIVGRKGKLRKKYCCFMPF